MTASARTTRETKLSLIPLFPFFPLCLCHYLLDFFPPRIRWFFFILFNVSVMFCDLFLDLVFIEEAAQKNASTEREWAVNLQVGNLFILPVSRTCTDNGRPELPKLVSGRQSFGPGHASHRPRRPAFQPPADTVAAGWDHFE